MARILDRTLYMRILEHLGRGQAWESAITLSKELQHEYETNAFNYTRLSELLSLQADLYAGIATSDRHFGYVSALPSSRFIFC